MGGLVEETRRGSSGTLRRGEGEGGRLEIIMAIASGADEESTRCV